MKDLSTIYLKNPNTKTAHIKASSNEDFRLNVEVPKKIAPKEVKPVRFTSIARTFVHAEQDKFLVSFNDILSGEVNYW